MTENPYDQNDTPSMHRAWQEGYEAGKEESRAALRDREKRELEALQELDESRAETARLREELARVNGDKLMLASELAARCFELEAARAELARVQRMYDGTRQALNRALFGERGEPIAPSDFELRCIAHQASASDEDRRNRALYDAGRAATEQALITPPAPVSPEGEER